MSRFRRSLSLWTGPSIICRRSFEHRDELLREVWGSLDSTVMTRAVDQTIARLRKKIEPDPHHPEFLRTAHRDGYCLNVEDRS